MKHMLFSLALSLGAAVAFGQTPQDSQGGSNSPQANQIQASPIEEWQIDGGDIVAYNPTYAFAPNYSSATYVYGLSRSHYRRHNFRHHTS